MAVTLSCSSCRSPIDVPGNHSAPTINCGICWTAVAVPSAGAAPPPVRATPVVAKALPAKPVPAAAALPAGAKPAAGMARLEALIHSASDKLRAAPAPAVVLPPLKPIVVAPQQVFDAEVVPTIAPNPRPAAPPAVAVPVLSSVPTRPRPTEKSKPKYGTRGESRGDDDDDDHRLRDRKAKTGTLVFALVGAGTLLLGLLVGGFFLVRYLTSESATPDAANAGAAGNGGKGNNFNVVPNANPVPNLAPPPVNPLPNPIPDPRDWVNPQPVPRNNFNPRQPEVKPARPEIELVPVREADGFTAGMPANVRVEDKHWEHLSDPVYNVLKCDGKKYTADENWYRYEIRFMDVPAGGRHDLVKMLSAFPKGNKIRPVRFAGHDGFEYVDGRTVARAVAVGCRAFVFKTEFQPVGGGDEAHADAARKKFFDSVKITFDPATPAPVNPQAPQMNRGGNIPGVGGFPGGNIPGFGGPPGGGDVPFGGKMLAAVARVDAFAAAVVLENKGEILFFGTRPAVGAGKPGGVVRRFTYPEFKPKNTFHLPFPVTYAVADEANGRFAVAAVTKADGSVGREQDRSIGFGDVQVFDIKAMYDGSVAEREELKPVSTIPFGAKIAGLEFADGKGYVLSLANTPANKTKPWKTKLTQIDLGQIKSVGELDLPEPAWRLKVAADGKKLFAAEVPLTAAGVPVLNVSRGANVLVVDVKTWRKDKTLTLPGPAFDLATRADGTLLASVSQAGVFRLYAVPDGGNPIDLNPEAGRPAVQGYVAASPDGKRYFTTPLTGAGVDSFDVTNLDGPAGIQSATSGRTVKVPPPGDGTMPVGGRVEITPDGKFALFGSGAVVDLGK